MKPKGKSSGTNPVDSKQTKVTLGKGQLTFPYLSYQEQKVPKMREIPRESGVGSTFKTNTRGIGIDYRETGVTNPAIQYPFEVVIHQKFRFWPALPADFTLASETYAAWVQIIHNMVDARYRALKEQEWQDDIWNSGMVAQLAGALTAFNIGLHSFIRWNSILSARLATGFGPVTNDASHDEYGRGKTLTKNSIVYAMEKLNDAIVEKSPECQEILSLGIKPILGIYEMTLKRYLVNIGVNGINDIYSRDTYVTRGGTAFCVQKRTDGALHDDCDGEVSLLVLLDHIEQLVMGLKPIWELVKQVFAGIMTKVLPTSNAAYIKDLEEFKVMEKPIDEDIYYARTLPFAVYSDHGVLLHEMNHNLDGNIDIFWTGHAYRPASYVLVTALGNFPAPPGSINLRLVYPAPVIGTMGQWFGTALVGGDNVNVFYLCWPHEPINGTPSARPQFTLRLLMDVPETTLLMTQLLDPLSANMFRIMANRGSQLLVGTVYDRVFGAPSVLAVGGFFGYNALDIYLVLKFYYPFCRYTRATWTADRIRLLLIDWVNAYYDGEDVVPAVSYHIAQMKQDKDVRKGPFLEDKRGPGKGDTTKPVTPEGVASAFNEPKEREDRAPEDPEEKRLGKDVQKSKRMEGRKSSAPAGKLKFYVSPEKYAAMSSEEKLALKKKREAAR